MTNWNRNVILNLLTASIGGIGDSIWSQTIFVYFLKQLTGTNTKVGIITAIQGGSQLLTAFPAGWAADKFSRAPVIAIGGVAMLLSIGAIGLGVVRSEDEQGAAIFDLLCVGLALNGLAGGINNGPAQVMLLVVCGFVDIVPNTHPTPRRALSKSRTLVSARLSLLTRFQPAIAIAFTTTFSSRIWAGRWRDLCCVSSSSRIGMDTPRTKRSGRWGSCRRLF